MYYNFYCNEKLLIDHFQESGEGNRMLKRLLAQSGLPPDKCADIYLQKMDNREGLYYDRFDVIQDFAERSTGVDSLTKLDKISVYKQDVDYIKGYIKDFHMTQRETMVLFGVIMMCRMMQTDTLDLTTKYKIQQFCSCFGKDITYKKEEMEHWYDDYHAPIGLRKVCDEYGALLRVPCEKGFGKVGCRYVYPGYGLEDKTILKQYIVTQNRNRLDLEYIFRDLGLDGVRFCGRCGREFKARSGRSKYCKNWVDDIRRKQTRNRVRKHRDARKNDVTQ